MKLIIVLFLLLVLPYFLFAEKLNIVFLVDSSRSMEGRALEFTRLALSDWFSHLQPEDSAALLSYDSRVQVLQRMTSDNRALTEAVQTLRTGQASALYDGFAKGIQLLQDDSGRPVLVFISDGDDNGSFFQYSDIEQMLLRQGITLIGLGIGNMDHRAYKSLSDASGGEYYSVSKVDEIPEKLMDIRNLIQNRNFEDTVVSSFERQSSSTIPALVIESTPLNSAVFIDNIFYGFTSDQPSRGSDHSNQLRIDRIQPGEHQVRIVTLGGDVLSSPESFEFTFRMGNTDAYLNSTILMRRATLIHSNGRRELIQPDALLDIQQSLDKFDRMFD